MKSVQRPLALAVLLVACAAKQDEPRVALTDVGFTLTLPRTMQQALDSLAPGFRTVPTTSFRSEVSQAAAAQGGMTAIFAAVGDFNHDGLTDAVVEGTMPGDSTLHVIAIMNGPKPTAVEVARFLSYDADAVGIYLSNPPKGVAGAFEVVDYPDSTLLYQYTPGGFQETNVGK